jgi:hypothetical protein
MRSLSDIQASGFSGDVSAFKAGDVTGPSSATDNRLPRFDGTGGKTLQAGQIEEDDFGNVGISALPRSDRKLTIGTGFTLVNENGTSVTEDSITSTINSYAGICSAHSAESYTGDVSATATLAGPSHYIALALNSDPLTGTSYASLDYAARFSVNEIQVVENGTTISTPFRSARIGDTIGVRRVGTTIEYLHNETVYHTTTGVSASTPLYLDSAFDGADGMALTGISFWQTSAVMERVEGEIEARAFRVLGDRQLIETNLTSSTAYHIPAFTGTDGKTVTQSPLRTDAYGNLWSGNNNGQYTSFTTIGLGGPLLGTTGAFKAFKADGDIGTLLWYYAPNGGTLELRPPPIANGGAPGDNFVFKWSGVNVVNLTYAADVIWATTWSAKERMRLTNDGRLLIAAHPTTITLNASYLSNNATVTADSIARTSGSGAWNASAYSEEKYRDDIALFTTLTGTAATAAIGLDTDPYVSDTVDTIDFAIKTLGGVLYVVENGAAVFTGPGYAIGDTIGVRRVGTSVEYLKNGTVFHTTTGVSTTTPLYLHASLFETGQTFSAITFQPPAGQSRLKVAGPIESTLGGVKFPDGSVQTTAATGGGGGSGDVTGPASAIDNAIMRADGTTGKVVQSSGASVTDAGKVISTGLETKSPSLATLVNDAGCTVTANSITATASGWGNAAAHSVESYAGDVSLSATVAGGTLGNSMLALNSDPATDNHYTSLDYACNISGAGGLWAYESPVNASSAFTVALGDVLTIRRVGTSIEYLKNGSIFHTTTGVSASTPLYLDTAFDATGAAFTEITFGPPGLAPIKVDGLIESTAGGVKFPDATTQTTAAFGGRGVTTVNFGAFPGKSDASVAITGQGGIASGSRVRAWLEATATADHSADEHWLETIGVIAGNIVPGTGFTIYAKNTGTLSEPVMEQWANTRLAGPGTGINQVRPDLGGGKGTRLYGQYTVAWEWI